MDRATLVSELDADVVAVNGSRPVGNAVGVDLATQDADRGRVALVRSGPDSARARGLRENDGKRRRGEESERSRLHFGRAKKDEKKLVGLETNRSLIWGILKDVGESSFEKEGFSSRDGCDKRFSRQRTKSRKKVRERKDCLSKGKNEWPAARLRQSVSL